MDPEGAARCHRRRRGIRRTKSAPRFMHCWRIEPQAQQWGQCLSPTAGGGYSAPHRLTGPRLFTELAQDRVSMVGFGISGVESTRQSVNQRKYS
jgi:hypothetical protein